MADKPPLPPSDVPEYKHIEPTKGFEAEREIKPPSKEAFEAAMKETPSPPGKEAEAARGISPMDLATPKTVVGGPSFETLLGQVNTIQPHLDQIQNNLNTPNLQLKNSYQKLLDNKLTEAKDQFNAVSEKLGIPIAEETKIAPEAGPIAKFLGYITDGQNQISAVKEKLLDLKKSGEELRPAELLLIQVKLSQAQQAIEYASVLLGKVVDIIKQMMNIPI